MSLFFTIFAGSGESRVTVTVGAYDPPGPPPPTLWGYNTITGPIGSCSPDNFLGYTIRWLMEDGAGDFEFQIENTGSELGASWFTSLTVGDDGGDVTLNSSDATHAFNDGADTESWTWTSTYWTGNWTDQAGNDHDVVMNF